MYAFNRLTNLYIKMYKKIKLKKKYITWTWYCPANQITCHLKKKKIKKCMFMHSWPFRNRKEIIKNIESPWCISIVFVQLPKTGLTDTHSLNIQCTIYINEIRYAMKWKGCRRRNKTNKNIKSIYYWYKEN